ncbi:hypothetical protein G9H61_04070 [Aquirufa ecclesiirivi]|uniref:Uncharacterized protein n=1 Tax=Aquirufa ecclesiirivi TaxID=2715124 RepID=A0ABT4JE97_9BACT|nr:hypothetical protein [Aquirufa ecclesiirivi]MCZ2474607.1 hypothetical protein [Aquirufa ecclesiirivi]MDF0694706.1 hypothetical protein [Aquirufa ecclesiirivi]
MTNTPKKKATEYLSLVEDSSTNFSEKRTWVSPEIVNWENANIENAPGLGSDGIAQTYF